nr:hypothetical protein [Phycicoccus sp. HDW14]
MAQVLQRGADGAVEPGVLGRDDHPVEVDGVGPRVGVEVRRGDPLAAHPHGQLDGAGRRDDDVAGQHSPVVGRGRLGPLGDDPDAVPRVDPHEAVVDHRCRGRDRLRHTVLDVREVGTVTGDGHLDPARDVAVPAVADGDDLVEAAVDEHPATHHLDGGVGVR